MAPKISTAGVPKRSTVASFVTKVFDIFNSPALPSVARFSDKGTTIVINDNKRFAAEILPQYFTHNKWSSFVRQLHMYDFYKIAGTDNTAEYRHRFFVKDRPDLLHYMHRKVSEVGSTNQAGDEAEVAAAAAAAAAAPPATSLRARRQDSDNLMAELALIRQQQLSMEKSMSLMQTDRAAMQSTLTDMAGVHRDLKRQNQELSQENRQLWARQEEMYQRQNVLQSRMARVMQFLYQMYVNQQHGQQSVEAGAQPSIEGEDHRQAMDAFASDGRFSGDALRQTLNFLGMSNEQLDNPPTPLRSVGGANDQWQNAARDAVRTMSHVQQKQQQQQQQQQQLQQQPDALALQPLAAPAPPRPQQIEAPPSLDSLPDIPMSPFAYDGSLNSADDNALLDMVSDDTREEWLNTLASPMMGSVPSSPYALPSPPPTLTLEDALSPPLMQTPAAGAGAGAATPQPQDGGDLKRRRIADKEGQVQACCAAQDDFEERLENFEHELHLEPAAAPAGR